MKKIIIVAFIIMFSSCKENDEEQKLMYAQLTNYRDELKMNTRDIDSYIQNFKEKEKIYESKTEGRSGILLEYEKSFEKLKFEERDKIVKLRDSFNREHKLNLHFDTSIYCDNVSDTVFNRLMEIDFYRLKISFQSRYLIGHRCF